MATWGQMWFIEHLDIDSLTAGSIISVFEIGGFCGATSSGFFADYMAKRHGGSRETPRSYSLVLFSSIACLSCLALLTLGTQLSICRICCFFYGYGMYGAIAMFGLIAREFVPSGHGGLASAALAVASQVGAFLACAPLAWLVGQKSFSEAFWIVTYCLPVALVMFAGMTSVNGKYIEKRVSKVTD